MEQIQLTEEQFKSVFTIIEKCLIDTLITEDDRKWYDECFRVAKEKGFIKQPPIEQAINEARCLFYQGLSPESFAVYITNLRTLYETAYTLLEKENKELKEQLNGKTNKQK